MDASTRQNYEEATAPRNQLHCTQTAWNGFLRRDQASSVYLLSSMHLIADKYFALLLLILGGLEIDPHTQRPVLFVTVAAGFDTASTATAEDG